MVDDKTFFQRLLYNAYMADAITLPEVLEACKRLSIPVPTPSQFIGNQATYQAPVFQTSEVNHGLHSN